MLLAQRERAASRPPLALVSIGGRYAVPNVPRGRSGLRCAPGGESWNLADSLTLPARMTTLETHSSQAWPKRAGDGGDMARARAASSNSGRDVKGRAPPRPRRSSGNGTGSSPERKRLSEKRKSAEVKHAPERGLRSLLADLDNVRKDFGSLVSKVKTRPLRSAAIAFATGLAASRLFGRR
jgi:hypothetical protein